MLTFLISVSVFASSQCPECGENTWDFEIVSATCTSSGYERYWCTSCGIERSFPGEPALGHDMESLFEMRYNPQLGIWVNVLVGEKCSRCSHSIYY